MIRGTPAGTIGIATRTWWMNRRLFPKILEHFIKHIDCSIENPENVVFMDKLGSHLGMDIIDMLREKGLRDYNLSTAYFTQIPPPGCDGLWATKTHLTKGVNEWNLSNLGQHIMIYDLLEFLSRSLYRALSVEDITAGFRKTGILF